MGAPLNGPPPATSADEPGVAKATAEDGAAVLTNAIANSVVFVAGSMADDVAKSGAATPVGKVGDLHAPS